MTWQPRRRRDPSRGLSARHPRRRRGPVSDYPRGARGVAATRPADYPRETETPRRPLRDVLWRHRDALLDLPTTLQCRCKKEDICASGALLWHLHRDERRWAAARHNATTELCGFFV